MKLKLTTRDGEFIDLQIYISREEIDTPEHVMARMFEHMLLNADAVKLATLVEHMATLFPARVTA